VELLAEIGVVLLLFTVGLEFSLGQLVGLWRTIVGAGTGQLVLTIGATAALASLYVPGSAKPIFFGFLMAMSSTAIVLRLLGDRGESEAPVGRICLAVLLFQDLCIVPLTLLVPVLAGQSAGGSDLLWKSVTGVVVVAAVLIAARYVVPHLLLSVVRTRSRELFLILLILLCLGTAYATSVAGLSLALGAFLAGLAVSQSEYSHQALAEAAPFRDAFGALFFISIGMLMDAGFVVSNAPVVAALVVLVVTVKLVASAVPVLLLGYPSRVALAAGFSLAQIGEFSFVLAHVGMKFGLLGDYDYQAFLSASAVTMLLTPLLMGGGHRLSVRVSGIHRLVPWRVPGAMLLEPEPELEDHVIIVGYGLNGRNVAHTLRAMEIPYTVLELNPDTVRRARAEGEPIHYGDCSRYETLAAVGIERARVLVIAIPEPSSIRAAVARARAKNSHLYIIVRTRFVSEVEDLRKLGADEVIPEEFETSVEIFSRVLARYQVPDNVISRCVDQIRDGMYHMLRAPSVRSDWASLSSAVGRGVHTRTVLLDDDSAGVGKSLVDLGVRQRTGVLVAAIHRESETLVNPPPETILKRGDTLLLLGQTEEFGAAITLVDRSC
jgi:CPA2 family monovalent cation:H+ antiporter-2